MRLIVVGKNSQHNLSSARIRLTMPHMSEENTSTLPEAKTPEHIARVRDLQNKLQKELAALLAHPLVPREFKKVFEEKE